ncbi:hypothetical protein DSO57_1001793 [Entomophthora muscae]|uniref:Uncharacterized protein n=1 Tax=Entomophthora muscae TaxID=34485 RepID=A0ACC2U7I1_9FUNG|nr:hypothetical protein DSO57_1001793 [Entomophthora muscae]
MAPHPIAAQKAISIKIIRFPLFVKDLATWVLGDPHCYEEIVESLNLSNVECLKFGLSKGLGLGIVFGGCIVKIPQIIVILRARSTRGISLVSYLLETFAYFITIAYNIRDRNAFSTWGEALLIAVQNVFIVMLMKFFKRKRFDAIMVLLVSFLIGYVMTDHEIVSEGVMSLLMALTIPVILLSRVPQIYTTYQHGSTGNISLFTVFNYFLGTAGRVYTTYQEVDDKLIQLGNVLAFLLNAIVLAQTLYYRNVPVKQA